MQIDVSIENNLVVCNCHQTKILNLACYHGVTE